MAGALGWLALAPQGEGPEGRNRDTIHRRSALLLARPLPYSLLTPARPPSPFPLIYKNVGSTKLGELYKGQPGPRLAGAGGAGRDRTEEAVSASAVCSDCRRPVAATPGRAWQGLAVQCAGRPVSQRQSGRPGTKTAVQTDKD